AGGRCPRSDPPAAEKAARHAHPACLSRSAARTDCARAREFRRGGESEFLSCAGQLEESVTRGTMRHLSDAQFVDLAELSEGARPPEHMRRHLETCTDCSARLQDLRAALTAVRTDEAPSPSPLLWDHFAARVSDAVRREPGFEPAGAFWMEWLRYPVSL